MNTVEAMPENKLSISDNTENYGLVSIIMPNYNAANYIKNTVESVMAQTYSCWELIFVDDCSTDNSLDVIRSFDDERIKIYSTDKNSGAATARNIAIDKACGKWIAFLDSDDLWLPDKLIRQLRFMSDNQYDFSCTSYEVINEDEKQVSVFVPQKDKYSYEDILKHNFIGCLTAVYNAEKLGKIYMPTAAVKREDLACWLSILKNGTEAYCLHEPLSKYKVHSNSVSSNKLKMLKYQWQVYRKVEKLNVFKSFYYLVHWAILGFIKYR